MFWALFYLKMNHYDDFGNQEVPTESGNIWGTTYKKVEEENKEIISVSSEGPTTTLKHNWQAECTTVKQRNALMFNNDFMADVFFRVGESPNSQLIPAHKYILATGSSVFHAMFFGSYGSTCNSKDVIIPDVEPIAFLNLLRY